MAAESGAEYPAVEGSGGTAAVAAPLRPFYRVEDDLRDHPGAFEFFQAVRLLLRISPDREVVGRFVPPSKEAVHFGVNHALSFPPAQIHQIDWRGPIPRMIVNFMGLTGPTGVLPYAYSELILERLRNRDSALASFLDIFNHRMISLFYQAWEKYRFDIAWERDGQDRISRYLMALIGLGTAGLQNRLEVRDEALLFYTGLLSLQPRSAVALRNLLEDYFGVPVEVEQFVGSWQPLDPTDQCVFEDADSYSEQVSIGAVVGDAIWDRQSRIRVKLGPMSDEHYLAFLPGGSAWEPLGTLTKFFCGMNLQVELQLILKQPDVPRCELGNETEAGPRLGWFTWMKSGSGFDRSPSDTILLLM